MVIIFISRKFHINIDVRYFLFILGKIKVFKILNGDFSFAVTIME